MQLVPSRIGANMYAPKNSARRVFYLCVSALGVNVGAFPEPTTSRESTQVHSGNDDVCPLKTAASANLLQLGSVIAHGDIRLEPVDVANTTSSSDFSENQICVFNKGRCVDVPLKGTSSTVVTFLEHVELVVTRAGEDLKWLDALAEFNTTVYNRAGPRDSLPRPRPNLRIVPQANTGREDEAMIRHIVSRYDTLADVTIFLQGWPFGHCPGLVDTVRLVARAMKFSTPTPADGPTAAIDGIFPLSRNYYLYNVPTGHVGFTTDLIQADKGKYEADSSDNDAFVRARELYSSECERIVGGRCPELQWVSEGAQWAVSRQRILTQPKETYERVLDRGEGNWGEFRGLVAEALWPHLWGVSGWEPRFFSNSGNTLEDNERSARNYDRKFLAPKPYCWNSDIQNPMESCDKFMASCEMHWRGGESPPSSFLQKRGRFSVVGEPQQATWVMRVAISASSIPGSPHHIVVDKGLIGLDRNCSSGDGVQWAISNVNHTRKGFVIAHQPDPGDGVLRKFINCDPASGRARLGSLPLLWNAKEGDLGAIMLQNEAGRKLQFHPTGVKAGRLKRFSHLLFCRTPVGAKNTATFKRFRFHLGAKAEL